MKRRAVIGGGLICVAVALLGGCQSSAGPRDYTPVSARFFLEAANGDGVPVRLPRSGVALTLNPKPVLTEGDVADVELVQVDLGRCLLFRLTTAATRDFYRLTGTHQGRRLVLLLDGEASGARRIDGVITNGVVYMFVERSEEELERLAVNLKKGALALQRELARKG